MNFDNEKKTFLAKLDRSKKGRIDKKVIPLLDIINSKNNFYTTSSCSGRVYLWKGTGKKFETEWLKVSHDLISKDFFELNAEGLVWLRVEPFILHLACKDLNSANKILNIAKKFYKKSCLLSFSNKIVIEVRGSEYIEMPLYKDNELIFSGNLIWLKELVNSKLEKIWQEIEKFKEELALLTD